MQHTFLTPDPDSDSGLTIDLEGDLAGILNLCTNNKKSLPLSDEDLRQIKLVSGIGFIFACPSLILGLYRDTLSRCTCG